VITAEGVDPCPDSFHHQAPPFPYFPPMANRAGLRPSLAPTRVHEHSFCSTHSVNLGFTSHNKPVLTHQLSWDLTTSATSPVFLPKSGRGYKHAVGFPSAFSLMFIYRADSDGFLCCLCRRIPTPPLSVSLKRCQHPTYSSSNRSMSEPNHQRPT
jgi:hypothetical protein